MNVSRPSPATARVVSNRRLTPEVFGLVLRLPSEWGPALPGQFVQLECPPRDAFALRRPFSLAACRSTELGIELSIVYGVVGLRTRELSRCHPGETLELIGPLGRPFTPSPGRFPVLVGGGRGIAPLLMLAETWKTDYPLGTILYGATTEARIIPVPDPPYVLHQATDDGSAGFSGTVVDLLEHLRKQREIIVDETALFACGPNRMLEGLARYSAEHGFPCQVSLETHFGCGMGICAGCAIPVRPAPGEAEDAFHRYILACREGPVMDAERVEWEGVPE